MGFDRENYELKEEYIYDPRILRQNIYTEDKYNTENPADPNSWFAATADAFTAMLGPLYIMEPNIAAARNALLTLYVDTFHPGKLSDLGPPVVIDGVEYPPTEVDKERIRSRVMFICTNLGILPYEDLFRLEMHSYDYWIRVIEDRGMTSLMDWLRYQEEQGRDLDDIGPDEIKKFRSKIKEEHDYRIGNKLPKWLTQERIITPQDHGIDRAMDLIKQIRKEKPEAVIGMMSGTFDPLHAIHAKQIYFYRQFCDFLVLIIDNDQYIQNVKEPTREKGRESFSEQRRLRDFHRFPHLWDIMMVSPINEPTHQAFVDLIRFLGPDHVFNHPEHEIYQVRNQQIIEGGSKVFDFTPFPLEPFSSTYFWHELLKRRKNGDI